MGGPGSIDQGPDFLHVAATVTLRVPQLTPDTPKSLRSCGSEANGKEENTKAATKYNLALVLSPSGDGGHQKETNNRPSSIFLNATVCPAICKNEGFSSA